jgi:hypothetical protein
MGSPYLSRHRESDPQGKPMEVWVQERGKSEGSSAMEGIGVEQTRKITPRENGQTSTRSPLTREQGKPIKEAKQMMVEQTGFSDKTYASTTGSSSSSHRRAREVIGLLLRGHVFPSREPQESEGCCRHAASAYAHVWLCAFPPPCDAAPLLESTEIRVRLNPYSRLRRPDFPRRLR